MSGQIIRALCATEIRSASGMTAGNRRVEAILTEPATDRMGDIVETKGLSITNHARTKTILFNHDADQPVAKTIAIGIEGGKLKAIAEFPEPGTSERADEIYGLIKAGVINATSIGFKPILTEPIDKAKPYGAIRYLTSELYEWSFVSVPALPSALITSRSAHGRGRVAARRQLARFRLVELRRRQRQLEAMVAGGAEPEPPTVMLTGRDAEQARKRARAKLAELCRPR